MNDIDDTNVRQELFRRNLETFKQNHVLAYEIVRRISEPMSKVVFGDNGEPDIEFQGTRLYGGKGAYTYSRDSLERQWENQKRLMITPPSSKTLDAYGGDFLTRLMKRCVDDGLSFTLTPHKDYVYHLLCFGLGLGAHIKPMCEKFNCRSLIVVEPNHEFLYHSCFFVDWAEIFEHFDRPGYQISFVFSDHYLKVEAEIRNTIRVINVAAFDGTAVFRLYDSTLMDRANQKLRENGSLVIAGLGFATDEVDMITNTFMNLKGGHALIYRRNPLRQEHPVFIVGSGPSIDGCLDDIRRSQDNAVIISLGTALTVLTRNGIIPDFHVELENVPAVYDVLAKFAKVVDFRATTLFCTTTVNPRVPTLFDQTVYFFRAGLASYPMFTLGSEHALYEVGPMVCNLGLSFALEMGFTSVYFFGVDLGARRPDVHHSRFAPYLESEESKYMDGNLALWEGDFNQWVPANFGGKAATGFYHMWSRDTLERQIVFARMGRQFYNCSDGVRINGTIPKRPETVTVPAKGDKHAGVRRMLDAFIAYTPEHFRQAWDDQDWKRRLCDFGEDLIGICKAEKTSDAEPENLYLDNFHRLLVKEADPPAEVLFYRGSILTAMCAAYLYAARVIPVERIGDFHRIAREEMIETVRRLQELAIQTVDKLNASR
jgi:hypothetical protein